jgi:hypothetical protein
VNPSRPKKALTRPAKKVTIWENRWLRKAMNPPLLPLVPDDWPLVPEAPLLVCPLVPLLWPELPEVPLEAPLLDSPLAPEEAWPEAPEEASPVLPLVPLLWPEVPEAPLLDSPLAPDAPDEAAKGIWPEVPVVPFVNITGEVASVGLKRESADTASPPVNSTAALPRRALPQNAFRFCACSKLSSSKCFITDTSSSLQGHQTLRI